MGVNYALPMRPKVKAESGPKRLNRLLQEGFNAAVTNHSTNFYITNKRGSIFQVSAAVIVRRRHSEMLQALEDCLC